MQRKSASQQIRSDAILIGILGLVIALTLYIKGGETLRIYLLAIVGIAVFGFLFVKVLNFITTTDRGASFAYIWNELLYTFIGIPIMAVAIFYLPVVIFLVFFSGDQYAVYLKVIVIAATVLAQIVSILILIKNIRKEKKTTKNGQKLLKNIEKESEERNLKELDA